MTYDSKENKGFAGLESMVSEVDLPEPIYRPTSISSALSNESTQSTKGRAFKIDENTIKPKPQRISLQTKWAIGIGLVVTVVIIANVSEKSGIEKLVEPSHEESMPDRGLGLLLSNDQIRYCLSQDIRLGAWKDSMKDDSNTAIDAFNAAVSDYNSKCSNFKYKKGALDSVRLEVETRRDALLIEGAVQAASNL